MEKKESNSISRREFLRRMGIGGATTAGAAALAACGAGGGRTDAARAGTAEIPKGMMSCRTNPRTGEKVSLLGYGCMRWPTVKGGSGRDTGDSLDQEQINRLVDYALAHGVNYFDTSPAYCRGESERATGIALKRHPRENYLVATKLSNFDPSTWSREKSMEMYQNSFRMLQVEKIDYYLLHGVGMGGDGMDNFRKRYVDNGMLDFLLAEREAGRIGNLGFSYHGDIKVFDHLLANHDKYKWDFAMIQMNYLDWRHAKEINPSNTNAEYLYGELVGRKIPVMIMEPLLGGRLSNVPGHVVERLKQREPQRSVASWAFRYCGTMPGVLTALSGMTYMEHLQDNLRSLCPLKPLTPDDIEYLYDTADIMVKYPTVPCNDCKYCMPCPYGIDIPAVLLHYNKCVNEGNVPKDRMSPNYREARRAFLVGYDRSVPRLRQADHCIGCSQCVPHCPQNIDVPKEMRRIDQFVEKLKRDTL